MKQRTLFPSWLLKWKHMRPASISDNDLFCLSIFLPLFLGFMLVFIGSYASEIGERIPRKPQLIRWHSNIEHREYMVLAEATVLQRRAIEFEANMDRFYNEMWYSRGGWVPEPYYNEESPPLWELNNGKWLWIGE